MNLENTKSLAAHDMKVVVSELADFYGIDITPEGAYLRLEQFGYPSLCIERTQPNLVSVARFRKEGGYWGDIAADPEIVFFIGCGIRENVAKAALNHNEGSQQLWIPFGIQLPYRPFKELGVIDQNGSNLTINNSDEIAEVVNISEEWAQKIKKSGWNDRSKVRATF